MSSKNSHKSAAKFILFATDLRRLPLIFFCFFLLNLSVPICANLWLSVFFVFNPICVYLCVSAANFSSALSVSTVSER